jgi:predicted RNA-binding protein with PIN domain
MLYLIDGNNVMGRKRTRRELLALLADFAAARKTRVQVIFDGAPEAGFPEGSAYKGVKIGYSRMGADADARIKKIVENSRNARELIVVTSDRALAGRARANGARHVSVSDFLALIEEALRMRAERSQLEKPEADNDVDEWLQLFGGEGE